MNKDTQNRLSRFSMRDCPDESALNDSYLSIVMGKVEIPHFEVDMDRAWDAFDMAGLSFGEFIAYVARQREYTMSALADALHIERSFLEDIYNDFVFPWDLGLELLNRISVTLDISMDTLKDLIENDPIDRRILRQKLQATENGTPVHQLLATDVRRAELYEALLDVQSEKEDEKRRQLVVQMETLCSTWW